MKLSVSAFRGAQTSARKKLFSNARLVPYYSAGSGGATASNSTTTTSGATASTAAALIVDDEMMVDNTGVAAGAASDRSIGVDAGAAQSAALPIVDVAVGRSETGAAAFASKCSKCDEKRSYDKHQRTRSNQRWMKLRTTVQLSGAISSTIQKSKPQLKREDSFLKRFSTRQMPEMQETMDMGDDGDGSSSQGEPETLRKLRRRKRQRRKKQPSTVVNPDENFYFYWLFSVTVSVLYNLWTLIVRQSFPEFQRLAESFWVTCDNLTDLVFFLDIVVQFRTGYLEQGLVVYDSKKLALHYVKSKSFILDLVTLLPLQLLQRTLGTCPILRFPRFLKIYRVYNYYYMVESRTVYPNLWRVANLIHILLILAHWFGCFYYLLSEVERFEGDWVFPNNSAGYDTLTRKYLGSLYWSTLTLTTIGDLPTPETDADRGNNTNGTTSTKRRRYKKSRILQFRSDTGFVFTIVSYLIGVFIFATIVGQVGNVITNRNANRLEFERLLDGAKTYMRHHKVPNGMKRRVLRWYDYSWSRGRIQGGGDINTALGLLPDKLKTELALHVNLSVLKKVTIFQECQPEFLHDLVLKMKAFIFTPGDLICRKGEVAREMFIIADGILEVISDTGHVLTTMMAGDFFGEIGILNLDGLNKRTADVRSVGYSELFSLSREDVLTAMKDYPEAQEILQSLGRKRLMEARSITKAIVEQKNRAKLNAAAAHNETQTSDHRTKNKIVEKLYSDVKGLKSVLRKSRHGTKSEDSLELEPLTSISGQTGSQFSGGGKGTLCRMKKVTSDEHWPTEDSSSMQEPCERHISASFPLLSKLKTLTDRHQQQQQRHYASPLPHQQATPTMHPGIQPSDIAVVQEHAEPEPLGAGLPLLQRLLLLKQKEDAEKRSIAAHLTTAVATTTATVAAVATSNYTTTANNNHNIDKHSNNNNSNNNNSNNNNSINNKNTTSTTNTICVGSTALSSPDAVAVTTVVEVPKKGKNGKKEVAFAEQVLIEQSLPTVERVSFRGHHVRDLLTCTSMADRDIPSSGTRSHFELLRRLMRAPTIEGYVARRSTLEKSVAYDNTTPNSPLPSSVASKMLFFSDYGNSGNDKDDGNGDGGGDDDDDDDDDDDYDDNGNDNDNADDDDEADEDKGDEGNGGNLVEGNALVANVIPDKHLSVERRAYASSESKHHVSTADAASYNALSFSVSGQGVDNDDDDACGGITNHLSNHDLRRHLPNYGRLSDKARLRDIEYQVREKDQVIRSLCWKIAELRKHHERCFQEQSSDDDTDCDTLEHPFMRDDSVDTVLLSPVQKNSSSASRERADPGQWVDDARRTLANHKRHSWEDRSAEERLELRELPTSIKPRLVWRNNVHIDMSGVDEAASIIDADEPFGELDDELLMARHDRNWEVRMLARELDRREHRALLMGRVVPKGGSKMLATHAPAAATALRSQLQSMRSLEERGSEVDVSMPSQRSASSGDIYKPPWSDVCPPLLSSSPSPIPPLGPVTVVKPRDATSNMLSVPPAAAFVPSGGSAPSCHLPLHYMSS